MPAATHLCRSSVLNQSALVVVVAVVVNVVVVVVVVLLLFLLLCLFILSRSLHDIQSTQTLPTRGEKRKQLL